MCNDIYTFLNAFIIHNYFSKWECLLVFLILNFYYEKFKPFKRLKAPPETPLHLQGKPVKHSNTYSAQIIFMYT